MVLARLSHEERIGLVVSIAGHVALLGVLVFRPASGDVVMPPDRIEVTLSDDVGLISTSPEPSVDAAADVAPEIGEVGEPEPPAAEPLPVSDRPAIAPVRPEPIARSTPQTPRRSERPGGSRIGNDFLEGTPGAQTSGSSTSPRAETIGPRVQAALSGAITRQLKPHWTAPPGVDAEQLVTILAWNLNEDGSLAGSPRVLRQLGVNAANRTQAPRHAELAIRAVQLAAPFDLPEEYYDSWKRIASFRFDKRLSQ